MPGAKGKLATGAAGPYGTSSRLSPRPDGIAAQGLAMGKDGSQANGTGGNLTQQQRRDYGLGDSPSPSGKMGAPGNLMVQAQGRSTTGGSVLYSAQAR